MLWLDLPGLPGLGAHETEHRDPEARSLMGFASNLHTPIDPENQKSKLPMSSETEVGSAEEQPAEG
jgi:hypothetical protein